MSPCTRDSPDRNGDCHATCKTYLDWKTSQAAKKKAMDAYYRKHGIKTGPVIELGSQKLY